MTEMQLKHAYALTERFTKIMIPKYTKGAQEHGGAIWDMTALELLDEAISETVDQFTYLMTLRDKIVHGNDFNPGK